MHTIYCVITTVHTLHLYKPKALKFQGHWPLTTLKMSLLIGRRIHEAHDWIKPKVQLSHELPAQLVNEMKC